MQHLRHLVCRPQPLADPEAFEPGPAALEYLQQECRVLVVGAGGLGCEILKGLALSGFARLDVIDMDNIDLTNLNRQFLFRQGDIGRPKAQVAAEFILDRCGHLGVFVESHVGRIQDKPLEFYKQFNIVISGLDSVEARRWLNALVHAAVERDEAGEVILSSIIVLLDGGTEGLRGQSRAIVPTMTSCFECSLDAFPPQTNYPLCTIADTPRLPEHCIEYAMVVLWDQESRQKLDTDNPEHLALLHQMASHRADVYGIPGVTYQLTVGVAKRIIPAVASTNCLVSSSLVLEALKLSTYCAPVLNSYMMYSGDEGVYCYTFPYEKKLECLVCGPEVKTMNVKRSQTLQELLDGLKKAPFELTNPSLTSDTAVVFIQRPRGLRKLHEYKLVQKLGQLAEAGVIREGGELTVTDPVTPSAMRLKLVFRE